MYLNKHNEMKSIEGLFLDKNQTISILAVFPVCLIGLLSICSTICTLISESQGLEKSRSASNLRKKYRSCKPGFFRSPPRKKARFIP